jgi:hypothetical protein
MVAGILLLVGSVFSNSNRITTTSSESDYLEYETIIYNSIHENPFNDDLRSLNNTGQGSNMPSTLITDEWTQKRTIWWILGEDIPHTITKPYVANIDGKSIPGFFNITMSDKSITTVEYHSINSIITDEHHFCKSRSYCIDRPWVTNTQVCSKIGGQKSCSEVLQIYCPTTIDYCRKIKDENPSEII